MLRWETIKSEFAWEGSLRDIYVLATSLSDWQAAWQLLRGGGFDATCTADGVTIPLPQNVGQIFAAQREPLFLVTVLLAGVDLNCHFFTEEEIEFDLDPRTVTGQLQLNALVSFMTELAVATGKAVLMTHENCSNAPFLRVAPTGAAEYISTDRSLP
jgi:hypothetical protein